MIKEHSKIMFSFLKGNIIIKLNELNVTFDVKILKFSCKTNNILGFIYNFKKCKCIYV